jgi:molybdenum cofactor cytidylyltransferase
VNAVAAVLAAGASRRLGVPKQLLELPTGNSLVRNAVLSALGSPAAATGLVVGAHAEAVIGQVRDLPVDVLRSHDAGEGIAASIRAAAGWATARNAQALLLCVCDQPLLAAGHLSALLELWSARRSLVASRYAGKRAVPAVFPCQYFTELSRLTGDAGAGALLRDAAEVALLDWPEGELDVDTPVDWDRHSARCSA